MALLASSWLILEYFLIPEGFLKWFYLSFYIQPLLLFCCQIFLWLKVLKKWLLLLFAPLAIAFRLGLFVSKRAVDSLFSFTADEVCYDAVGTHIQNISWEIVASYASRWDETNACRVGPNPCHSFESREEIDRDSSVGSSWLNEYLLSDHYNCSASYYDADVSENLVLPDQENSTTLFRICSAVDFESIFSEEVILKNEDSENSPSQMLEDMLVISQENTFSPISSCDSNDCFVDRKSCASNSPLKQQLIITSCEEDVDSFHQKYTSRMRFFNVLYHERLHGMNAILNDDSTSPHFFNFTEQATDTPMQLMWLSRMARKRILRSLECDLETIYVAQCCLFWEALLHQHLKVEALTFSENVMFDDMVSKKFQELEILMVRSVEDQKFEFQGSSTSILNRLSFQGLLQVPDATGFMIGEEENRIREGIRARQVVEAIDNCIQAFWLYLKTDNKKVSSWKHETIWRAHPSVEDPQDLELLYNVTKTMHKKGIMLKDVQGKSKCWLRRKVKGVQTEDEKRSVLFAMIDMKLVQRLLQMSLVSRSHLRWCQEKLNNLDFKQGKVLRGCIDHLFPSS